MDPDMDCMFNEKKWSNYLFYSTFQNILSINLEGCSSTDQILNLFPKG